MTSDEPLMTMTVEIKDPDKANEVEIFLTSEDLAFLIRDLQMLEAGRSDHIHYMSPEWGGDELGETPRRAGSKIVNHLKINLTDDKKIGGSK